MRWGQSRNCEFRTYPVRYSYDAQGRMSSMTTWTGFATLAGPEVTTWVHFLELFSELRGRYGVAVHAYVRKDNHYHLLLETPEVTR